MSMTHLRIPRCLYDAIRAEAEKAYPEENCGVLLGRAYDGDWEIAAAIPVRNASTAAARAHYAIAPAELVRIVRQAREQFLEIAGFYHSHPDCPALWSATDLEEAHWIGASYVITEVARGAAAATCSFRLDGTAEEDKRFAAEAIELTGA